MKPAAMCGASLLTLAIVYYILQTLIEREHGADHVLKHAIGRDWQGKLSPLFYLGGIIMAFVAPFVSWLLYVAVAMIWLAG